MIRNMFSSLKFRVTVIIFIILVISFGIFIYVETGYHLRVHSTEIRKEIVTAVNLNVEKVDRYTRSMEQKAIDLALAGEAFYRMRQKSPDVNLDDEMITYLVDSYEAFPEAIGGGIWYDPYQFYEDVKYYGPYAFWEKETVVFTWDLNTPEYDYLNQDWYLLALPMGWNRSVKRQEEYYWTAPYYDEAGSFSLMITVDAFMYDDAGNIIGITTSDWALNKMLNFLENTKITPDSHTFLVDANSNTIMANTIDKNLVMKHTSSAAWLSRLDDAKEGEIKEAILEINEIDYHTYYSITEVGMLYGIMVPTETLRKPIMKITLLNIFMASGLGLFLLIVLFMILSGITRPIEQLTEAGRKIADGKLNVKVPAIKGRDEIKELGDTINLLIGAIKFLRKDNKTRKSRKKKK